MSTRLIHREKIDPEVGSLEDADEGRENSTSMIEKTV